MFIVYYIAGMAAVLAMTVKEWCVQVWLAQS